MEHSTRNQSPIERPKPKPKSPYVIKRLGKSHLYQVKERETGQVLAYGTLENAKRQLRVLEANGPKFM
jgi:hypothetical protein